MREHEEWERHWNTISLGIVTVATAAIGVALFATDLTEAANSWTRYSLVIIAVLRICAWSIWEAASSSQHRKTLLDKEPANGNSRSSYMCGLVLNCSP